MSLRGANLPRPDTSWHAEAQALHRQGLTPRAIAESLDKTIFAVRKVIARKAEPSIPLLPLIEAFFSFPEAGPKRLADLTGLSVHDVVDQLIAKEFPLSKRFLSNANSGEGKG